MVPCYSLAVADKQWGVYDERKDTKTAYLFRDKRLLIEAARTISVLAGEAWDGCFGEP